MEHGNGRRPVLVTGAQGFIGRRLIRRLIDQVETVVAFDTAPLPATEQDGHDRRLIAWHGDIRWADERCIE